MLFFVQAPAALLPQIQAVLLQETLDRSVRYAYSDFPDLSSLGIETYVRCRWSSASKGLQMLMIVAVFLLKEHGKPSESAYHHIHVADVISDICDILALTSWGEFTRSWAIAFDTLES